MKPTLPKIPLKAVLGASTALVAFGALTPSAEAAGLTFFGEDLGLGEAMRLASTPNSDNARDEFFSNLVGVGTEDFESFTPGASGSLELSFPGAGTATLTGGGNVESQPSGTNGFGRYPVSGDQYYETNTGNFAIDFSNPVAAFGFYGVDFGDFDGEIQIELEFLNGLSEIINVPSTIGAPGGSASYLGYVAMAGNEFSKAVFSNTGSSQDIFGFDDFTIGSSEQVVPPTNEVPTPALLPGLIGMGVAALRKRKKGEERAEEA